MRTNDSGDGAAMTRTLAKRNWLTAVWGNPLARDVDRWHAGLRMVLITLWAVLLPVAAVTGYLVSSDGLDRARTQAHDHIATKAVLTEAAPAMVFTASGVPVMGNTAVAAQWVAVDGTTRSGHVPAQSGSVVGTPVDIWTDRSGALIGEPKSPSGAVVDGVLVALGMMLFWGLLLAGVLKCCANRFDRRRSAEWDRDWMRVAPMWFRQS
jgi:hypothetical protein